MSDANFVQKAVREGVKDIVGAYNEAIDKFVADPDVRLAIKMAAGAGVLQRIFQRLQDASPAEDASQKKDAGEQGAPGTTPGNFDSWVDGQF